MDETLKAKHVHAFAYAISDLISPEPSSDNDALITPATSTTVTVNGIKFNSRPFFNDSLQIFNASSKLISPGLIIIILSYVKFILMII